MSIVLPALFTHFSFNLFFIRLSYNLPVYFVLLCNCSVLSVVSVKNENYNNKKKKKDAIKNVQSRDTGIIWHTKRKQTKQNTQHNICWAPLYPNRQNKNTIRHISPLEVKTNRTLDKENTKHIIFHKKKSSENTCFASYLIKTKIK